MADDNDDFDLEPDGTDTGTQVTDEPDAPPEEDEDLAAR
jgi:hypothetical protein